MSRKIILKRTAGLKDRVAENISARRAYQEIAGHLMPVARITLKKYCLKSDFVLAKI